MQEFTSWTPLEPSRIKETLPAAPAAVELKVSDRLIQYAEGQSSLIAYLYFSDSARQQLLSRVDQLRSYEDAKGPVKFRFLQDGRAKQILKKRIHRFMTRFGEAPLYNQHD
jgi:hypothetical protein